MREIRPNGLRHYIQIKKTLVIVTPLGTCSGLETLFQLVLACLRVIQLILAYPPFSIYSQLLQLLSTFFIYNFIGSLNIYILSFVQLYVLISFFDFFSRCNKYAAKFRMKKFSLKIRVKLKIQGLFQKSVRGMHAFFGLQFLKKRNFYCFAPLNRCHFSPFLVKTSFSKLRALNYMQQPHAKKVQNSSCNTTEFHAQSRLMKENIIKT